MRKHGKNSKYYGEFKETEQAKSYEIETHADFIKGNLKIWAWAIVCIFGSTLLATFLCLIIMGGKLWKFGKKLKEL